MPAAAGRGDLRASHADREQVIGILKAAFVQGMLAKDEFDLRVGQALASRTFAELTALTADIPAGVGAARPPQPARAQRKGRRLRPGLVLAVVTVVYAGVWPAAVAFPDSGADHDSQAGIALVVMSTFCYMLLVLVLGVVMIDSWQVKRSGRQLPGGPAPGAGGQESPRLRSADPGRQLPPVDPGRRHTAEAARIVRPRLLPS
jgi:hypothetical protein